MKKLLAALLALTLLATGLALAEEYAVYSVGDILDALKQPDCDALVFRDDQSDGPAELVIDRMIAVDRPFRVEARRSFTSVRIVEGGALLLTEDAVLGTRGTIDFANGIFAIGQFWVDGGMLGAKQCAVEDYTTFYVTGGELMTLPAALPGGVDVIGGARSEEELLSCLADDVYTSVFVQADVALTRDAAVNRYLRVTDGATLTVEGCTLTVGEGAQLEVYNTCGLVNRGGIVNHGEVHIEAEATYSGEIPEGEGAFNRD